MHCRGQVCPIGLTYLAITSGSPEQSVVGISCAGRGAGVFGRSPRLRRRVGGRVVGAELAVVGQQCPYDARVLVGQGHGRHVGVASLEQPAQPTGDFLRLALGGMQDRARSMDQQRAQIHVAPLADAQ